MSSHGQQRLKLTLARNGIAAALTENKVRPGSVEVFICDAEEMRATNLRTRGIDEATDVLTFPAPEEVPMILGEIAVCLDFVNQGAAMRKVSPSQELAMLCIHGALHLAGFDDQTEADHRLMVAEMNRIALLVGVKPDPAWESVPHP